MNLLACPQARELEEFLFGVKARDPASIFEQHEAESDDEEGLTLSDLALKVLNYAFNKPA